MMLSLYTDYLFMHGIFLPPLEEMWRFSPIPLSSGHPPIQNALRIFEALLHHFA
jgi:hypothetical protein